MSLSSLIAFSFGLWKLFLPIIDPWPPPSFIALISFINSSSFFASPPENTTTLLPLKQDLVICLTLSDKELIFTEGCQEGGPHIGSWNVGERYATSIINDLNIRSSRNATYHRWS